MSQRIRCSNNRYYLNALFDLELGGVPVESVRRSAAEMSVLFLPRCLENDAVVLDVEVSREYLAYLNENGILPSLSVSIFSEKDSPSGVWNDIVWGWNRAAAERLGVSTETSHQPSLPVVQTINGRQFCHEVAHTGGYGVKKSKFCRTITEFDALLAGTQLPYPLVIKPAFGSSGFGFLVLATSGEVNAKRSDISRYGAYGGFVVEPWCQRCGDVSTGGHIAATGAVGKIHMHSQWVNRFGAFFGIYIGDDDPDLTPLRSVLSEMTGKYLKATAAAGYYGPVGIDSFLYRDNGAVRLAAGIEINGRYTMGALAHHLRDRIAPQSCFLLRFISRKQCLLPETYSAFCAALGNSLFNAVTGAGILLLTPLRAGFGGVWRQPQRSVFVIIAPTREQVMFYDAVLLNCFSRKKGVDKNVN